VNDALRGEIYAAVYRFDGERIETLLPPGVHRPDQLAAEAPTPVVIAGDHTAAGASLRQSWPGCVVVGAPAGAPHARTLLGLVNRPGGATRVEQVEAWQPVYGRPAEAQARWETAHGRPLPDSIGSRG
jgi:tRNA A37 threonylcarbamoyladenosine modification protein TsaB